MKPRTDTGHLRCGRTRGCVGAGVLREPAGIEPTRRPRQGGHRQGLCRQREAPRPRRWAHRRLRGEGRRQRATRHGPRGADRRHGHVRDCRRPLPRVAPVAPHHRANGTRCDVSGVHGGHSHVLFVHGESRCAPAAAAVQARGDGAVHLCRRCHAARGLLGIRGLRSSPWRRRPRRQGVATNAGVAVAFRAPVRRVRVLLATGRPGAPCRCVRRVAVGGRSLGRMEHHHQGDDRRSRHCIAR